MSDDVHVTGGGAVEVDTDSLDRAAGGFDGVADDLDRLGDRARRVRDAIDGVAGVTGGAGLDSAGAACARLDDAVQRGRHLSRSLRETSSIYTIVELTVEQSLALAAGDRARADVAAARLAAARAADPHAALLAGAAMMAWRLQTESAAAHDLSSPVAGLGLWGADGAGLLFPAAISLLGTGVVPRGAVPIGPAPAVAVRAIGTPGLATTAPPSLAAAISRVPTGAPDDDDVDGDSRVRVDASTMPDGSVEYTVYLTGTQQWGLGTDEPFDFPSDVELYQGQNAASLQAAKAALAAAGAGPGAALTIVGFSQGGMVGAWLAQDPTYDTKALVVAGSPVATDLPPDVLSVSLVHDDDPVAALQGVGLGAPTGSPESVVVTRTADPATGPWDVRFPAHRQDVYIDTAQLFEASGDPRVEGVEALFDHLRTATSTVTTEYAAVRG